MLICLYGFRGAWQLINKNNRVPRFIVIVLQAVVLITAVVWLIQLFPFLPKLKPISVKSNSLPYIAIVLVMAVLLTRAILYRARHLWPDIVVSLLLCLIIVSNQFVLTRIVGNGRMNIEFKMLADWYVKNAKPDEIMLTSMSNVVRIFAPKHSKNFIHSIKAENPNDFIRLCYEKNITYIAWDSRIGYAPKWRYYKSWGYKNMAMLIKPESIGPYEFITQIKADKRHLINVFRLRKNPLLYKPKNNAAP